MIRGRVALGLISASLACLVWTASAGAATVRYAKPGAGGPEPCTSAAPCSLADAILGHAGGDVVNGDSVVLFSGFGDYNPGVALNTSAAIDIGGEPGKPAPTINHTLGFGLLSAAATLHDVRLVQTSPGGVGLVMSGGTAERVSVSAAATGCRTTGVLRDSICISAGVSGGNAIDLGSSVSTFISNTTLRNVTAVGGGSSAAIRANAQNGGQVNVDGVNVLATGGFTQISGTADADPGSRATLTFTHSLYATANAGGINPSSVSLTPAGTNGNLTAAPQFVNQAGGDFHELATSPSVDAGIAAPDLGSLDLDRALRSQSTCLGGTPIPDIGAYELAPPQPPVAACSVFKIGKLKLNKKKGTGELHITVPGSGSLKASAKGMKKSSANPTAAGDIKLTLKASGKQKKKLADKGKLKLKLKLAWTPTGGAAATQTDKVKLKKK
ncbi:MAG: hypothetical protein QOD60_2611 [Solirubrobacterales bacterium]|jgi:hypothetical protein|nr:hypothetical protein [Solirubrobacterales bacterium]